MPLHTVFKRSDEFPSFECVLAWRKVKQMEQDKRSFRVLLSDLLLHIDMRIIAYDAFENRANGNHHSA